MLRITLNSEPRSFPSPLAVAELLRTLGKDSKKLAVEVNRIVVPRSQHEQHALSNGDEVEIVTLVGGLPASAYRHSAWWSNNAIGHVQAQAWLNAGRLVTAIDLVGERVWFSSSRQ